MALITDGRFSGGSHGFIVGHVTPEAQDGGPIALVENGDTITLDADKNAITVELSDCRAGRARARLAGAALQIHPRHALQVHQEREIGRRGVRNRRIAPNGVSPTAGAADMAIGRK